MTWGARGGVEDGDKKEDRYRGWEIVRLGRGGVQLVGTMFSPPPLLQGSSGSVSLPHHTWDGLSLLFQGPKAGD